MTAQETIPLRRKLQIKPGLVLVRLTEEGTSPTAEFCISVPDGAEEAISVVSNPLSQDTTLRKGGDCLILRCVKTCSVELLAQPKQAQGRISGRVQVEYLTDQGAKRAQAPAAPAKKEAQPNVPVNGGVKTGHAAAQNQASGGVCQAPWRARSSDSWRVPWRIGPQGQFRNG